jgi:hypothetical protein
MCACASLPRPLRSQNVVAICDRRRPLTLRTKASLTAANRTTTDVTTSDTSYTVTGRVMYADGTVTDNAGASWQAVYLPVKAGDLVTYKGQLGSGNSGELMAYVIQLDNALRSWWWAYIPRRGTRATGPYRVRRLRTVRLCPRSCDSDGRYDYENGPVVRFLRQYHGRTSNR